MTSKDDEYRISLIMPVYNAKPYIDTALQSVKNQTIGFEHIELILVDDCSTDGSYEMISAWAAGFPNVIVKQTARNSGTPAEPRNLGLDCARAPFVMFLDNDDALHPNACKALYDEICASNVDIVTGEATIMTAKGMPDEDCRRYLSCTKDFALGYQLMELPLSDWIVPYLNNHWSKIYRRSIIDEHHIRCLPGELWEDILFLFLYLSCVRDMAHINDPILLYRARPKSLSHDHNMRFYSSLPKSISFGMHRAKELGQENARRYAELLHYSDTIEYHIDQLFEDQHLSLDNLDKCLLAWKDIFLFGAAYDLQYHSAYCKILSDDFLDGTDEKALFHFHTLKDLYLQRKKEKNDILNSRSYRFGKKLSDLKSKLTGSTD